MAITRWVSALLLACAIPPTDAWAQAQVNTAPHRVVSLDMCTDWLLAYYAPRSQVLALSPLSRRYPMPWLSDPWPAHDGTLERLLQLKPDLVITGEYNALALRQRLVSLGVRVEVLKLPASLAQLAAYERQLLDSLGLPASASNVADVFDVDDATAPSNAPRKRLLLLGANGIGTGAGTFEDEILRRAGWDNYVREPGYAPLDLERVIADPPDAILSAAPEHPALANRFMTHPALRRAVAASRWISTDYWRWECPGPWTMELVQELRGMR